MLRMVTADVWYGDRFAVRECGWKTGTILNVAHTCRKHPEYWEDVGRLHSEVAYLRMAKRDRQPWNDEYPCQLWYTLEYATLPILTHCQMGGHRGPTAAIFAAWMLNKRRGVFLEETLAQVQAQIPHLQLDARGDRCLYHKQMIAFCRKWST